MTDQVETVGNYDKLCKLAEGTYGVVYKGRVTGSDDIVALKKFKQRDGGIGVCDFVMREVALLKSLQHKNIVCLRDVVFSDKNKMYLVFEFIDTDLRKYMDAVRISQPTTKKFMKQLLDGIAFCHSRRIMHRDLKPENILIDSTGNLKIGDFGLARTFSMRTRKYTQEITTIWYRAPEILLGSSYYSAPVDMWAAGLLFAEMLRKGRPMFPGDSEIDQLCRIFRVLGTPSEDMWHGVTQLSGFKPHFPKYPPESLDGMIENTDANTRSLLDGMLVYDPNKRASAAQCLAHSYFSDSG